MLRGCSLYYSKFVVQRPLVSHSFLFSCLPKPPVESCKFMDIYVAFILPVVLPKICCSPYTVWICVEWFTVWYSHPQLLKSMYFKNWLIWVTEWAKADTVCGERGYRMARLMRDLFRVQRHSWKTSIPWLSCSAAAFVLLLSLTGLTQLVSELLSHVFCVLGRGRGKTLSTWFCWYWNRSLFWLCYSCVQIPCFLHCSVDTVGE